MTNLNTSEENFSDNEELNEKEQAANHSLDIYTNTGVYIEENKEHGDILIVFGTDVLEICLRQFYLSEENKLFTRVCSKDEWSSWFVVQPNSTETGSIDFNTFNEPNLIKISTSQNHSNAPEDLNSTIKDNMENMLVCMSVEEDHTIQFLIGANRRNFWVRHYKTQEWNNWERFI